MERSASSRMDIPPWERADRPQVSYMDSASAALSPGEREALLALWATRSDTVAQPIGDLDVAIVNRTVSRRARSFSTNTRTSDRVKMPTTAPLFHDSKPVYIPAGPRTEPNLPSFVTAPKSNILTPSPSMYPPIQHPVKVVKGLSTSPASDVESWSSPSPHHSLTAPFMPPRPLPPVSSWNSGIDASPQNAHKCTCLHRKRPSRMTRWKSALKDIFHPVDDPNLEHIETPHWTEQ